MPISISKSGGNQYDAAGPYLDARAKARATQNDYDIAMRKLSQEAMNAALDFQSQMAGNNMQAALANQRTIATSQLATQQDKQEAAMVTQRAKDETKLLTQRGRQDIGLVNQRGAIDSAIARQQEGGQARRDQRLNLYEQQLTGQRAGISANAAAQEFGYTSQRDKQQTLDQLKRDALQQGYTLQRDRSQQNDLLQRDERQQGYQTQNDERQFGYQSQRDARLQGYEVQNDERQFGQQTQRDVMQDTFASRRERQQQKDLLQRDSSQFGYDTQREQQQQGYQAQRDERLQGYDVQNDDRQFGQQWLRDERLNEFDTQRDYRQQGYTQQNATQRETFNVASKWQDQITQARNAGLDFSADQSKEAQSLNRTLTKIVNDPTLDEGQKQLARLIIQQKLAAIVPDEPVRRPQDALQQSLLFDERVPGVPFMMGYDSQGRPTFEPLGGGGPKQEDPAKKAAEMKKMDFAREADLEKITAAVNAYALHPETREPKPEFKDGDKISQDKIDAEIMKRFAGRDLRYQQYGLPPHEITQHHAQKEQQKQYLELQKQGQERQQRWQGTPLDQLPSHYDRRPPQRTQQQQKPATPPPVLSIKGKLPPDVVKQLKAVPGGDQLQKIRDKYKSNSVNDQQVRMAADIVINATLTKDDSDPDLAEAIETLRRAGFKMGP